MKRSVGLALAGLICLSLTCGIALAQKTNRELLEELQSEAPRNSGVVSVPSPMQPRLPEVTGPAAAIRQGASSPAYRNLNDEDANRTQRRILEQLR